MKNLCQLRQEGEAIRAARLREERLTLIFLLSSTGVAGVIAAVSIAMLFMAWTPEVRSGRAELREGRYLDARR